jgi:hypothetical protein
VVSGVVIIATYGVISCVGYLLDGDVSLGTLLWTSFVLSNLAAWTRSYSRLNQPIITSPAPNSPGSPMTPGTPDRRLKHKHSGDQGDWSALSSPAMKV